jgi:hypothetical protein
MTKHNGSIRDLSESVELRKANAAGEQRVMVAAFRGVRANALIIAVRGGAEP